MPDLVVIGGGVIGAAVADEMARRGASVTLVERDALASGASGRNMGLWLPPEDPATAAMGRRSLDAYLALADDAPVPFRIDRTPRGYLLLAVHDDDWSADARSRGRSPMQGSSSRRFRTATWQRSIRPTRTASPPHGASRKDAGSIRARSVIARRAGRRERRHDRAPPHRPETSNATVASRGC